MPTLVPVLLWNESLMTALAMNIFRHILSLHQTSLVNSAAHIYGERIYDQRIVSTRHQFTTYVTLGEAYHNYHHAFPWDYSASEFGWKINYNPMTGFIDACAKMGLAWDRNVASDFVVQDRINKFGDSEKLEKFQRQPSEGVFWDTAKGFFYLFWALWVLLAGRMVVNGLLGVGKLA